MTRIFPCYLDSVEVHLLIVHEDGTATPQVVFDRESDFGKISSTFSGIFNQYSLLNISFDVQEEPTVETSEDMIRGFLVSELDTLVFNGKFVVDFDENRIEAFFTTTGKITDKTLSLP